MTLAILVFAVCYARISKVVATHRRKVCPAEQRSRPRPHIGEKITIMQRFSHRTTNSQISDQFQNQLRERQKANTVALVVCFAMLCYGPLGVVFVLRGIMGDTYELVYLADPWADLIMFLNSVINPLLYCLRAKDIRHYIIRILPAGIKKFFSSNYYG